MSKTVAIGAQNFEELQAKDYFYIDKPNFIKEWWNNFSLSIMKEGESYFKDFA